MNRKAFVEQVEKIARHCRAEGQTVKINSGLPWVAIKRGEGPENTFFFQGEEAVDLLDSVPDDLNPEDCILWSAQGW